MPTYNAERWIRTAIESVLLQTHKRLELVISDGGSMDATVQIVRSYDDPRIRIDVAPHRLKAISNWNRSVLLSTGQYIKFLHQDDTIVPTCVEEMLSLALDDPRIGLVFARRQVVLPESPSAEELAWLERYGDLYQCFSGLDRVNDGYNLFSQMVAGGLEENWIGEPSSVLATKACLARVGMFNPRLHQAMDLELWCRAMLHFRVGFVDRVLSTYLHHSDSMTGENERLGRGWLDRLWLLEALLAEAPPGPARDRLAELRRAALGKAVRTQTRRVLLRRFSGEFSEYALYRLRGAVGRAPALYPDFPVTEG
jgi:glycosyltransferase involved in cell wall biosynthesis